jgi:transcriptional regulator with XRE-family HTH domain
MEESKKYTLRVDADLLEKLIGERMRQRIKEEVRFPYTILSLQQVAGLLRISPHTLSRWLNSERPPELPVIEISSRGGSRWRMW